MTAPALRALRQGAGTLTTGAKDLLDNRTQRRLRGLVAAIAVDRSAPRSALVVGDVPAWLRDAVAVRFAARDIPDVGAGVEAADLVIAVGALTSALHPHERLAELSAASRRHLLVLEPRKPLRRGAAHTLPGLQRVLSAQVAVREVATPLPWTAVWAVRV